MPQASRSLHSPGSIRRSRVSALDGRSKMPAYRHRTYLGQALRIFKGRPHLLNELARTTFKKGQLLRLMGQDSEAETAILQAYEMRKELEPQDTRSLEELEEKDFNMLVAFWSR